MNLVWRWGRWSWFPMKPLDASASHEELLSGWLGKGPQLQRPAMSSWQQRLPRDSNRSNNSNSITRKQAANRSARLRIGPAQSGRPSAAGSAEKLSERKFRLGARGCQRQIRQLIRHRSACGGHCRHRDAETNKNGTSSGPVALVELHSAPVEVT